MSPTQKRLYSFVFAGCLIFSFFFSVGCKNENEKAELSESKSSAIIQGDSELKVNLGEISVNRTNVAFIGDGLTIRTSLAEGDTDYVDYLAEKTGLIPFRFGERSLTASNMDKNASSNTLTGLIQEKAIELASCDVMVLWLGTQDFHASAEIGTVVDTTPATFCGGLNYAIDTYRAINPSGKIVLLTPLYSSVRLNENEKFLLDYREAVMAIAVEQETYLVDTYYLYNVYSIETVSTFGGYVDSKGHEAIANCILTNMIDMSGSKTVSDLYEKLLPSDNLWNPLNSENRTCVFYGDSISDKYGVFLPEYVQEPDYVEWMSIKLGLIHKRFAIGGTTYGFDTTMLPALQNSHAVANIERNIKQNQDADIAVLFYGTNDYFLSLEVGEPGCGDVKTTCGAMQLAIDTLKKHNPSIQIVILTPIARTQGAANAGQGLKNALGYIVDDYTRAIREVAEENDVWLCQLDRLFSPETYTWDVKQDDVHPNHNGHKLMADFIIFNTERIINE